MFRTYLSRGALLAIVAGPAMLAAGSLKAAPEMVGGVDKVQAEATAAQAGATRQLETKGALYFKDKLRTGPGARLEAKLFGGANTMQGLSDIGAMNAGFAVRFLEREGIHLVSSCLGGDRGRRIQFWPVSGLARRRFMVGTEAVPVQRPVPPPAPAFGALELF